MDPRIEELVAQGYPLDVAKRMVESGGYDKMTNPLPFLGGVSALSNTGNSNPMGQLNFDNTNTATSPPAEGGSLSDVSPEIQALLDQGYNLEEANQILEYRAAGPDSPTPFLGTTGNNTPNSNDPYALANMFSNAGAGISLDTAAFGLGRAIGSDKGVDRTLSIIGNAGKLTLGTARGIASGLGQMKASQNAQDYYNERTQEGTGRTTYTPISQSGNTNYTGGYSYGEDGGIKGKTLPLKDFLKSGGFKKPGVKKLM